MAMAHAVDNITASSSEIMLLLTGNKADVNVRGAVRSSVGRYLLHSVVLCPSQLFGGSTCQKRR